MRPVTVPTGRALSAGKVPVTEKARAEREPEIRPRRGRGTSNENSRHGPLQFVSSGASASLLLISQEHLFFHAPVVSPKFHSLLPFSSANRIHTKLQLCHGLSQGKRRIFLQCQLYPTFWGKLILPLGDYFAGHTARVATVHLRNAEVQHSASATILLKAAEEVIAFRSW